MAVSGRACSEHGNKAGLGRDSRVHAAAWAQAMLGSEHKSMCGWRRGARQH